VEGENRLYTVLCLAGGLFCLALSLLYSSPFAASVAAICFFSSLALWKYGYLIVPRLARKAGVVEVGQGFEITSAQDAAVSRGNGVFLATVFLSAKLYESASERDERGRAAMCAMYERAISSVGFPFKASMLLCPLDMGSELEELRTKRAVAESRKERLSSGGKNDAELARLKREIAMWEAQIGRLTSGEKPLEVLFYLSTTASGTSKEEAVASAKRQGKELATVVGSALSCEVAPLVGEDMKKCMRFESMLPVDVDELRDALF